MCQHFFPKILVEMITKLKVGWKEVNEERQAEDEMGGKVQMAAWNQHTQFHFLDSPYAFNPKPQEKWKLLTMPTWIPNPNFSGQRS